MSNKAPNTPWWIYLTLVLLGLLLFLPIREMLGLSYLQYKSFAGWVALGYAFIGGILMYITSEGEDKKERWFFAVICFCVLAAVLLILFCGAQWIADHVDF